jgi:hypothetical protein
VYALAASGQGDVTVAVSGYSVWTDLPGAPFFETSYCWILAADATGSYLRGVMAGDFGAQLAMANDGSLAWSNSYGLNVAPPSGEPVTLPGPYVTREGLQYKHGIGFDGSLVWAGAEYASDDPAFPRELGVYPSSTAVVGRPLNGASQPPAFALQLLQTTNPYGPDVARFDVQNGRIVAMTRVTETLALGDEHYFSQADGTQAVLIAVDTETSP